MKKYPSIEQFRHVIKAVQLQHDYQGKDEQEDAIYKHINDYPILDFHGTVKLHGTNASVVKYKDRVEYQSRENVLSLIKDNAGFCLAMSNKDLDFLFKDVEFQEYIAVYGEWCGMGIQKGVGISKCPKMFVIFGYKIDGVWVNKIIHDNLQNIYHIEQFPTFDVKIDFNTPQLSQNKLIELTIEVENECPVAKQLGFPNEIGEGIVFTCSTNPEYKFKSKGEKHSVSKVTTLNAVDTQMLEGIVSFVDLALQEERLLQGIDHLKQENKELSEKSTGDFLRWIVNDVIKEEQDTIIKNQFDVKKVNSSISHKARQWYFNYLNS
tara:strand:- start:4147 stop:5112 length:966 start_codon:yes stop_codon:yes gene_type:complete